jgi:hypothetical protein
MDWITLGSGSGKRPVVIVSPAVFDADSEIALLLLSATEHDKLHKDAKAFLNDKHVFDHDVNSVALPTHAKSDRKNGTYMVVVQHWPDSAAAGRCLYK